MQLTYDSPVNCPAFAAASVAGWACASTTTANSVRAQALCCGQGLVPYKLLLLATDEQDGNEVAELLRGTGSFSQVDVRSTTIGTPSVSQLGLYTGVLVWSSSPLFNATALGDNLADYWDAGGRVVATVFFNFSPNSQLSGKWASGTYNLLSQAGIDSSTQETGNGIINNASSPLVAGVALLTSSIKSTGTEINNGVVVAQWGSGAPLIVHAVKNGNRNMVALNMFPTSSRRGISFWSINTDGVAVMRNALLFPS
jgi:hypothetical protein